MSKLFTHIAGLSVVFGTLIGFVALSPSVSAVVDNDPDCDNVAIIRCGAFSAETLRHKASQGDVPRVYNAFNISQNDLSGQFVNGIVWRDGRVTVGDKVVATNAMTAGRNYGGTPIAGTDGAGRYPTSRFVTEGQTAFIRMVDGKFDFAIIKSCGNPVTGNPTPPPAPTPPPPAPAQPKEIKVCVLATWELKTINESNFDKTKYTKDLEKCKPIKVCVIATGEIKKIKLGEFDKTKHSKVLADCKKASSPDMVKVCELSTKNIIEIKRTDYDNTKHSEDLEKCQEETPQVLASTGPETAVMSLMGSSALGYGAYSYFQSRRHLLTKLLGR